jgi:hypothetical protein
MAGWHASWTWLLPGLLLPAATGILWQELSAPGATPVPTDRTVEVRANALAGDGAIIGPFRLAGALELASDDAAFGGVSGLAAQPDGRLLAVTDAGQWLDFAPVVRDGRLAGVAGVVMGAFANAGEKSGMDGEAVAFTPDGRTLISLEQQHRILAFEGIGPPRRPEGTIFRTASAGWPPNGGGEALAALPDGSLLWISEQARLDDGSYVALCLTPDGLTRSVAIPALAGFSPTDAAVLDDGRLLLLHRFYSGATLEAAITLVDLAGVRTGGDRATSRLLARWDRDSAWPLDNMEGLALVSEAGKPVLYVVSDNNFNLAQRSLLLRLELIAPL